MKRLLVIFLMSSWLISNSQNITTYHIQPGSHYCDESNFWTTSSYIQNFWIKFDNSCLYNQALVISGWNKAYGFGDFNNQQNSCRLGWRCYGKLNKIIVCLYTHVNGTIITAPIDTLEVDKGYLTKLWWENGYYKLSINKRSVQIAKQGQPTNQYQQYPYFGGQSVNPNQYPMLFYINRL